ncbi:glycosyltransferase family 4 protein [Blastococcus sp. SYSU DS0973]
MRDTRRLERLERRLVKRPGRVLALSRHDVIRLQAWGVAADHLPVPLHHYSSSRTRTPRQASTIGFIGKLDWPPNRRAVGSLLDEVLPRLKERMGTAAPRVVIAGAGSEDMSHYDSVVGLGVVATVSSFYDAVDVVVVPRFGTGESGVSVKMLEALEHAKVVIAPRALAAAAGVEGRIIPADSPDEVVEAIVSLTPTT